MCVWKRWWIGKRDHLEGGGSRHGERGRTIGGESGGGGQLLPRYLVVCVLRPTLIYLNTAIIMRFWKLFVLKLAGLSNLMAPPIPRSNSSTHFSLPYACECNHFNSLVLYWIHLKSNSRRPNNSIHLNFLVIDIGYSFLVYHFYINAAAMWQHSYVIEYTCIVLKWLNYLKFVLWLLIQGSRPLCNYMRSVDLGGTSTNTTPCSSRRPSPPSSYFPSPVASYQPSPTSTTFPSPSRVDANLSSNPFSFMHQSYHPSLPPFRISNSAPVTPPLSSPITNISMQNFNWESIAKQSASLNFPILAASCPASPTRSQRFTPATIPECNESDSTISSGQWMSFQAYVPTVSPTSPTFTLVKPVSRNESSILEKRKGKEFEFESVPVKAWEGERIHEVGLDDLELALGLGSTRN